MQPLTKDLRTFLSQGSSLMSMWNSWSHEVAPPKNCKSDETNLCGLLQRSGFCAVAMNLLVRLNHNHEWPWRGGSLFGGPSKSPIHLAPGTRQIMTWRSNAINPLSETANPIQFSSLSWPPTRAASKEPRYTGFFLFLSFGEIRSASQCPCPPVFSNSGCGHGDLL